MKCVWSLSHRTHPPLRILLILLLHMSIMFLDLYTLGATTRECEFWIACLLEYFASVALWIQDNFNTLIESLSCTSSFFRHNDGFNIILWWRSSLYKRRWGFGFIPLYMVEKEKRKRDLRFTVLPCDTTTVETAATKRWSEFTTAWEQSCLGKDQQIWVWKYLRRWQMGLVTNPRQLWLTAVPQLTTCLMYCRLLV